MKVQRTTFAKEKKNIKVQKSLEKLNIFHFTKSF